MTNIADDCEIDGCGFNLPKIDILNPFRNHITWTCSKCFSGLCSPFFLSGQEFLWFWSGINTGANPERWAAHHLEVAWTSQNSHYNHGQGKHYKRKHLFNLK